LNKGFSALVIDDDDFSRRTAVRLLLRLEAGAVLEAADGDAAIASAAGAADGLDVIVCDLRMPGLNGIETLRHLAATNRSALFVVASGVDAQLLHWARDGVASFGIEALHVVEKPLTLDKLRRILSAAEVPVVEAALVVPAVLLPGVSLGAPVITVADIHQALANDEFVAYFQPKVSIASGQVIGAEALARWNHPKYGILEPGRFIGRLLESDLGGDLTDRMLRQALSLCVAWNETGFRAQVSVNVPLSCLTERDAPEALDALMREFGIAPERLILEVAEKEWASITRLAREVLTRIRLRGFGLAIDHFGAAVTSIQQLLDAPFSEMKLDGACIRAACTDASAATAIVASVGMAHRLGTVVVGEGAETQRDWDFLERSGCDLVQGYFVARPMPADAFLPWMLAWNRRERRVVTAG
jgi:EAL domain-containing protein (putative c-di-GMP-specific phosphodiesterase class I)/ActR/RegA family two-component response regulator